jgi:hexosaminidase
MPDFCFSCFVFTVAGMSIIPNVASFEMRAGAFVLSSNTVLVAAGGAAPEAEQLAAQLRAGTGFAWPVQSSAADSSISMTLDASLAHLGDEGYVLEVSPERIDIRAPKAAGLFYAGITLLQLLPPAVFSNTPQASVNWAVPTQRIEDQPRFRWRGMHLDVARHFMPLPFIKKFIDLLALHKMNVFHWHLTEDQGWRLEIKKYPKLTEVGAWRKETRAGHERDAAGFDGIPHGGFYTQDEAREVVAYAAARHINVVPEIEMPGHAQAAIAAYPELGNTDEKLEVWPQFGINKHVVNVEERTVLFYQDVLREVMDIFPSQFIHVGGDECPKDEWRASERAQARMQELGLKDEHELQSWFIRRMDAFLNEHGRTLIGWDEILEGGLAPNAVVMSWRGEEGGIAASKAGHDVVMAPNRYVYFDYYITEDKANEPLAIGGFLPLDKVYGYEPVPAQLSADEAQHVLGAQGELWTEYMKTPAQVEYMAFPRVCALSEVVWSPAARKDYADFLQRMQTHTQRLDALQVNYRRL